MSDTIQPEAIDHTHFFVGDTYYGHTGILDMAMGPLADIRAHDRARIDKWKAAVGKNDTVLHLGDFAGDEVSFQDGASIFGELNGDQANRTDGVAGVKVQSSPPITPVVAKSRA